MKKFIAKYMLYIYLNFIIDKDMDIYNNWALPFIKIVLFIRSIYTWSASILFFPIFIIGMKFEKNRKQYEKIILEKSDLTVSSVAYDVIKNIFAK